MRREVTPAAGAHGLTSKHNRRTLHISDSSLWTMQSAHDFGIAKRSQSNQNISRLTESESTVHDIVGSE